MATQTFIMQRQWESSKELAGYMKEFKLLLSMNTGWPLGEREACVYIRVFVLETVEMMINLCRNTMHLRCCRNKQGCKSRERSAEAVSAGVG